MTKQKQLATQEKKSLVIKFADKYSVDSDKLLHTLKNTCFKTKEQITNEQMMALLVVADQYGLNPFTREIYAYPDKGSIVPVVGVDGWSRIINDHPMMDGIEFVYSDTTKEHKSKTVHEWIDCIIYRKDRKVPVKIREYFDEVVRISDYKSPWDTHPNRFHRHKTLIQCARVAFGFGGIYDEDEAQRIKDGKATPTPQKQASDTLAELNDEKPDVVIDNEEATVTFYDDMQDDNDFLNEVVAEQASFDQIK